MQILINTVLFCGYFPLALFLFYRGVHHDQQTGRLGFCSESGSAEASSCVLGAGALIARLVSTVFGVSISTPLGSWTAAKTAHISLRVA